MKAFVKGVKVMDRHCVIVICQGASTGCWLYNRRSFDSLRGVPGKNGVSVIEITPAKACLDDFPG